MGIVDEYLDIKEKTESVLAMQVGDFYEFFGEDAREVSKALGLKLSKKSSHGSSYDMAGVPINDLDEYVKTLVSSKGYRVTVANQYETSSGNYKRKVDRVVTPSTIVDTSEQTASYLCSIVTEGDNCGVSFTDLDSGEVVTQDSDLDSLVGDISVYNPVEIIIATESYDKQLFDKLRNAVKSYIDATVHYQGEAMSVSNSKNLIEEKFGEMFLRSIDIDRNRVLKSVATILEYLNETNTRQDTITRLRSHNRSEYMSVDEKTRRSLEISEIMSSNSGTTLYDVMDKTKSPVGGEQLDKILKKPLKNIEKIEQRQENIGFLIDEGLLRRKLRSELDSYPHIRKFVRKCSYRTVTPNQVRQIADSISKFNNISDLLEYSVENTEINRRVKKVSSYDELKSIESLIKSCLREDPGNSVQEGIIKNGFDEELDKVVEKCENNLEWLDNLEKTVAEENNISHISVSSNKTDGYYIQVGNSEAGRVPDSFDKIKSLKNSERFKTDNLKQKEREIMRLQDRRYEIEKRIFDELVDDIASHSDVLQEVGKVVARLDALQSIAEHSVENDWRKPEVTNQTVGINIENGRHPVVEQQVSFVPNGTDMSQSNSFHIITGPNMAGKSTYMRQVALIVLLTQCGCYVPCDDARIEIFDAIFTRVGAVDEISEGKSTFMTEMSELSNILHSSTDKSLVILDEIGRGTSTVDGISIAQSTVEYLAEENNCVSPYTLFATHYHRLTKLEDDIPSVKNYHMSVSTQGDNMKFTRNIEEGSAKQSYGVNVAEMAGIPKRICSRSREIIDSIEDDGGLP